MTQRSSLGKMRYILIYLHIFIASILIASLFNEFLLIKPLIKFYDSSINITRARSEKTAQNLYYDEVKYGYIKPKFTDSYYEISGPTHRIWNVASPYLLIMYGFVVCWL